MSNRCELCGRQPVNTTIHHLTPREMGGALLPTAELCIPCHKQIHSLFTNRDLVALGLTSIQALLDNERMLPYIRWIRKQPPTLLPRVRKSRHVRNS